MGKHKKRRHEDRDEKAEIFRKVQKLNDQVQRLFGQSTGDSREDKENQENGNLTSPASKASDIPKNDEKTQSPPVPLIFAPDASVPETIISTQPPEGTVPPEDEPVIVNLENEASSLDPEVLEVLGADPSKSQELEVSLEGELEARWTFWLTKPLEKEVLDKLMNSYPRSSTKCQFEAPKLNPEILAISTDALIERDKKFCASQNLTGSALVALGTAISDLLQNEEVDKLDLLQKLCDAGKLMTQIHRGFSSTRRAFISPSLNKQVRDVLEATSPDHQLYGSNLSEKVKEVKTLSKLSQDLKVTPALPKKNSLNPKGPPVKFRRPQAGTRPRGNPRGSNSYPSNSYNRKPPARPPKSQVPAPTAPSNAQEAKKW
ncbi:uncharacterized protein LOC107048333 [Diachasma alloeum]|uniref:uncharacterized protein LOC107048333 n=1 Tax=Diachasma alloeum TaxID=454923 RepID=UPI0007383FA4|nr:uncharacterized protein LOC107048333 [Diachasma alloeum]